MNYWTLEDDAMLIKFHSENMSYAAIGKLLGRGKNSCISRSRRLKLTARPTPKHPEPKDRIHKTPTTAIVSKTTHCAPLPKWEHTGGIDIMALREGMCRFPTEKDLYCGGVVVRGAYCHHHAEICYQPRGKKK